MSAGVYSTEYPSRVLRTVLEVPRDTEWIEFEVGNSSPEAMENVPDDEVSGSSTVPRPSR